MDDVGTYLAAIVPTIGVTVLFYFIVKAMMEGDRRERLAQSQLDAEHDRAEQEDPSAATDTANTSHTASGTPPERPPTDSAERQSSSE